MFLEPGTKEEDHQRESSEEKVAGASATHGTEGEKTGGGKWGGEGAKCTTGATQNACRTKRCRGTVNNFFNKYN